MDGLEYVVIDDEELDGLVFDINQDTIDSKIEHLKPYRTFGGTIPPITKQAEKSVSVKQVKAWRMCAEGDEPWFIMEDDIIFNTYAFKTVEEISKYQNWDIVMFGFSSGLSAGNGFNQVTPPMTRGLSAYLLHPDFARKIKDDCLNVSMAIDWELNYLTQKHGCRMFWYEPFLFGQGSRTGLFKSAIQD
jgi:hypothetical protein